MTTETREIDLLARELYEGDPEPTYAWLRENAPVYWDGANELWGLSRHADVVAVSREPKRFCSGEGSRPNIPSDSSMINKDDPHHSALRRVLSSQITPRGVRPLEERVRAIAREHIDAVLEKGSLEVVQDLARPLPVRTIVGLLGFEDADWPQYAKIAEVTMESGGGPRYFTEETITQATKFFEIAAGVIEARRAAPTHDWISMMVAKADAGPAARTTEELAHESLLILNGGSDTTRHVIAGGTLALLQHPDQLELLRREPERIPVAVEEMIRWVSPLLNMRRTATEDTEFSGQKIRKGDQLLLMYASANRDPEVFDEPQRFDVTRHPNPHVAFGIGAHFCLGANLARLELRVTFEEMLARLPNLRLAGSDAPPVHANAFARGITRLEVAFG